MRLALVFAGLIMLGTISVPVRAGVIKPTSTAVAAFGQGQAYERLFQDINLSPGTCAIALERPRCQADLQLVSQLRAQDPTDLSAAKWFASGDIRLRVQNWNGIYVPDATWIDDPIFAWWYTAGVASVAASLPQVEGVDNYLGSIADVMAKHASAAPDSSSKWVPRGSTAYARILPLQVALQEVFPIEPYPTPMFGEEPGSYARLGIYVSTLQELVDNPSALSRPESRAFAAAVIARLQELHVTFADGLTAASLQAAVSQPISMDRKWLDTTWRKPLSQSLNTKWPEKARQEFAMGMLIAQVAYNAAVYKDVNADATFRGVIATLPAWTGMSAKVRIDIGALQNIPYATKGGKWEDINAAATAAVLDIAN